MRNIRNGLGLRTRISRERSLGKITLRTVNTPTGANELNNGGDEDCAIFFFFTNERMTYAHIWCPFVK